MNAETAAVCAAARITPMFGWLARDCTVAIERPARWDDLKAAFRTVRGGTMAATDLMLFDSLVVAATAAAEGRRGR